jgi:hypothetical protein
MCSSITPVLPGLLRPGGAQACSQGRKPLEQSHLTLKPRRGVGGFAGFCLRPSGALNIVWPSYQGLAPLATCRRPSGPWDTLIRTTLRCWR